MTWLQWHIGVYGHGPVRWNSFWAGFGSDLGEAAIIGWLCAFLRKHNCEVHRCWRLGRHGTAAGHVVCRRHHPDGKLTVTAVAQAHAAARGGQAQ